MLRNLLNQFSEKCWDFEMTKLPSFPCSDGIKHNLSLFTNSVCIHNILQDLLILLFQIVSLFKISGFYDSIVTLRDIKNWRLCKLNNLIWTCCRLWWDSFVVVPTLKHFYFTTAVMFKTISLRFILKMKSIV